MSSSPLQFYGYSKCSTCRKAEKSLRERGYSLQVFDITREPPSAALLEKVLRSGYTLKQLYNTSGEMYRSMGIKEKAARMTEAEQLQLLSRNGKLIKRPIVVQPGRVTVGFKEDEFLKVWS